MSIPASVLNTNLASMIARRNLGSAQISLAESVERLSSGLRINRAKDDAAGMAVSSVIEGQTRIAATAHRNVNDAISMVQTAEGALQEANAMLSRIKELATQGANDSMSQEQYYFLVQEMKQLMEELANTADRTTFNGNKLLGSGPDNATRRVTTTTTTTQTTGVAQNTWTSVDSSGLLSGITGSNQIRVVVEITDGNVKLESIPSGVNASISGYGNATDGTATAIALEGSKAAVTAALVALRAKRTGSGDADIELEVYELVPNQQNGNGNNLGSEVVSLDEQSFKANTPAIIPRGTNVNPTYTINHPDLGSIQVSTRGCFYGQAVGNTPQLWTNTALTLVDDTPTVGSPLTLDANAANVFETGFGLSGTPIYNGPVSILFSKPIAAVGFFVAGLNAIGATVVQAYDSNGNSLGIVADDNPVPGWLGTPTSGIYKDEFFGLATADGSSRIAGISVYMTGNELFGFSVDRLTLGSKDSLNAGVLVTPTLRTNSFVKLEPERIITVPVTVTTMEPGQEYRAWQFLSGAGNDDAIRLEGIPMWDTATAAAERSNGKGYAGDSVRVGALNALYQRILWLSDPANGPLETGQGYDIFSKNAQGISGAPEQEIFDKDGSLISSLTKSLNDLVDDSMLQINAHRSYFGAYAGRMEHNIANLAAQSENLTAAVSRIRDTDYGFETAKLTRTQILQQAATAMLAQANAMPNVVLGLLRQS